MDVETFAAERGARLSQHDTDLRPIVAEALARHGQSGWQEAIVTGASVLWLEVFEAAAPGAHSDVMLERFGRQLRDALDKTAAPDEEPTDSQVDRVTYWVSTFTANHAELEGTTAFGRQEMVWVSRRDEKVRAAHVAADGQRVRVGRKFTVGGEEVRFPGEPIGDPANWIQCRCLVRGSGRVRPMVAAGEDESFEERSTAVIVALPAADDPVATASSEDIPHITMVWLGESAALTVDVEELKRELGEWAAKIDGPLTEAVSGRATLGKDAADVVLIDAKSLAEIRNGMVQLRTRDGWDEWEPIGVAHDATEQFPTWLPHVTLGYPNMPPTSDYSGEQITFDRLALWVGNDRTEFPMGTATQPEAEPVVAAAVVPETEEPSEIEEIGEIADDQAGDEPSIDDEFEIPFHGVAAPIGKPSGDRRMFSKLTSRPLPIPLRYVDADTGAHDGAVRVGTIHTVEERDGMLRYEGLFKPGLSEPLVEKAIEGIVDGSARGVSLDADDVVYVTPENIDQEVVYENAAEAFDATMNPEPTKVEARMAALTIVAVPAFVEQFIALGTWAEAEDSGHEEAVENDPEEAEPVEDEPVVASGVETFAPGTKDGPGWVTNPEDTNRLRKYWVHGKGALKIKWGVPGDFNRCRSQLAKYIRNPNWLAGTCANMHKEALKVWPGQEGGATHSLAASGAEPAEMFTLIASGSPVAPAEWFDNPQLDNVTPLVITDEGRVYGHIADWTTCHIGLPGCTTAPHSSEGYPYFRTGAVRTDRGDIPVGQITLATGHADRYANARRAVAHYDNTGTAVMDVAAGEDEHGIWVAGMLRPGLTAEQLHTVRAASFSGDWREIRGRYEMVAALGCNVPGFPLPRVSMVASAGRPVSLVAAGIIVREPGQQADHSVDTLAVAVADIIQGREQRAKRLAAARQFARQERLTHARSLVTIKE